MQLPPGDPDHPPPSHVEHSVPCPVALERGHGAMEAVTIQFDDHALSPPQAIALDPGARNTDRSIDLRPRQREAVEEGDEAILELAPRNGGTVLG